MSDDEARGNESSGKKESPTPTHCLFVGDKTKTKKKYTNSKKKKKKAEAREINQDKFYSFYVFDPVLINHLFITP